MVASSVALQAVRSMLGLYDGVFRGVHAFFRGTVCVASVNRRASSSLR